MSKPEDIEAYLDKSKRTQHKITREHIGKRVLFNEKYARVRMPTEATILEIDPSETYFKFRNTRNDELWFAIEDYVIVSVLASVFASRKKESTPLAGIPDAATPPQFALPARLPYKPEVPYTLTWPPGSGPLYRGTGDPIYPLVTIECNCQQEGEWDFSVNAPGHGYFPKHIQH